MKKDDNLMFAHEIFLHGFLLKLCLFLDIHAKCEFLSETLLLICILMERFSSGDLVLICNIET